MCGECVEMSINSGERPKETPEVVHCEIQKVKERVMFLLTYASLTRKFYILREVRQFHNFLNTLEEDIDKPKLATFSLAERAGESFGLIRCPPCSRA